MESQDQADLRRERQRQYNRTYRQRHKDKCRDYCREYKRKLRAGYSPEQWQEERQRQRVWRASPNRIAKRRRFIEFVNAVKCYYGCANPECLAGSLHPCQLDFHHLDTDAKYRGVSTMGNCSPAKIAAEMSKCCILCANCHRLATWVGLDCSEFQRCNVTEDWKVVGPA